MWKQPIDGLFHNVIEKAVQVELFLSRGYELTLDDMAVCLWLAAWRHREVMVSDSDLEFDESSSNSGRVHYTHCRDNTVGKRSKLSLTKKKRK